MSRASPCSVESSDRFRGLEAAGEALFSGTAAPVADRGGGGGGDGTLCSLADTTGGLDADAARPMSASTPSS